MKPQSHNIYIQHCPITQKFKRLLGSTAAEVPVDFQSDTIKITNLVA